MDWFKSDDNKPCIVLEYCEGNLEDAYKKRMEQGVSFTEKEIIRILTMLSISLDYIGSVNVVHRDIKPANILISSIGDKKVFKLTDFGISYNDYESKWTTLNQSKTLFYASLE